MKEARIVIAGSRTFKNYDLLKQEAFDFIIYNSDVKPEEIEIVSGCARGADSLGEKFAEEMGYTVKQFPAD